MKCLNKNIEFIYLLVICTILIKLLNVLGVILIPDTIFPIFWFIIFVIGIFVTRDDYNRFYNVKYKCKSIIIILLTSLILYFSSGLLVGYHYNTYTNKTIYEVLKNLYIFIVPIIFQEYIRGIFCNYTRNNKFLKIFISILYILINYNFYSILGFFNTGEELLNFFFNLITLSVLELTTTYVAKVGSYKLSFIYRFIISLYIIFIPIVPNLHFVILSIFEIIVSIIIYLTMYKIYIKENKESKKKLKIKKVFEYIPILVVIIIFLLNQINIFKYKMTVVMSNSMEPTYYTGDYVVIKKIEKEEIDKLKKGDIIAFYDKNKRIVIHRIKEVINQKEKYFVTKGDSSKYVDNNPIETKDIVGKYTVRIRFLGYPKKIIYDILKR